MDDLLNRSCLWHFIGRQNFGIMPWVGENHSSMLQQYIEHWYRDGMNEYLCMYVLVRIVVVVVPLYGPWDGVVVQDVSKKMGAPSGFRYIAVFYLLANTGTTLDRGTNCKVLAGSLLWISHHMRSCVTKLAVLAMLASTGSIPRNTDEYRWQYSQYFQN